MTTSELSQTDRAFLMLVYDHQIQMCREGLDTAYKPLASAGHEVAQRLVDAGYLLASFTHADEIYPRYTLSSRGRILVAGWRWQGVT